MRTLDFEYHLIRDNAFLGLLHAPLDRGNTLRMDNGGEIKMSLSGTFSEQATDVDGNEITVNFLSDEIRPMMIIDGVEFPLGVYSVAKAVPSETNGIRRLKIEAFDRCWRVRDNYTEDILHFPAGMNYLAAIESQLIESGIENVLATPTSAVLTEDREDWEIGTSRLAIVNQLLGEINYNQLWFTTNGTAVLEPASVPTAENIEHTMSDLPEDQLQGAVKIDRMLPAITRETDVYAAPNVFLCVCSNPDKDAAMVAKAENTNPQSQLSIRRRGRRIMKMERVDNIASQAELQAYADRLCNESIIGGETIRVATALQPGYGVADVVAIKYGDLNAICIERAFSMELNVGGKMTHELERVVYNIV